MKEMENHKELYKKRRVSKFTGELLPISDREVIEHYTANNSGMELGYHLYNRLNISTQIAKRKYIISNLPAKEITKIKQIEIKKVNMEFTDKISRHIEVLEVIDKSNFGNNIEDFNEVAFKSMIKQFSKMYDRETLNYVADKCTYQKEVADKAIELLEVIKWLIKNAKRN